MIKRAGRRLYYRYDSTIVTIPEEEKGRQQRRDLIKNTREGRQLARRAVVGTVVPRRRKEEEGGRGVGIFEKGYRPQLLLLRTTRGTAW